MILFLRNISELQNELEFEKLKREKLEAQLDSNRQELEKYIKNLREYETKVNFNLENFKKFEMFNIMHFY